MAKARQQHRQQSLSVGWPGRSASAAPAQAARREGLPRPAQSPQSRRTSPDWRLCGQSTFPGCIRDCATLSPGSPSPGATRFPSAAPPQGHLILARRASEGQRPALARASGECGVAPCATGSWSARAARATTFSPCRLLGTGFLCRGGGGAALALSPGAEAAPAHPKGRSSCRAGLNRHPVAADALRRGACRCGQLAGGLGRSAHRAGRRGACGRGRW